MTILLAGCREPVTQLGRPNAEQLFSALGARTANPDRDPKYDSARVRIASAAVLPSRVWNDTSVWTGISSARRTLMVRGVAGERYRLEAAADVEQPARRSDARHLITLTRFTKDEFAWDTEVLFALGAVPARATGALVGALFAGGQGKTEAELRSEFRSALPRSGAILGQLFRVDSIHTATFGDQSTLSTYHVTITPKQIEAQYPNFAKYMARYAQTARMHWTLTDRSGISYFDCSLRDGRVQLRVRARGGRLVALTGDATPLPDSLTLNGDLTVRVRHFTVGFHDYHAEFTIDRADHDRAWTIVSRREPEWVLPLITERLLRTPLRRPFQGSGAYFRIGVRDGEPGPTLLYRRLHLDVQESMILRFIGRLGAIAVSDYTGIVEREQYVWLNGFFTALVADVRAPDASSGN